MSLLRLDCCIPLLGRRGNGRSKILCRPELSAPPVIGGGVAVELIAGYGMPDRCRPLASCPRRRLLDGRLPTLSACWSVSLRRRSADTIAVLRIAICARSCSFRPFPESRRKSIHVSPFAKSCSLKISARRDKTSPSLCPRRSDSPAPASRLPVSWPSRPVKSWRRLSVLRCSAEPDSAECGSIQEPNVSLDLLFGRPLDVGEEFGDESWCRRCSSVGDDERIWWPCGRT